MAKTSNCWNSFYDEFKPVQPWYKCKEPSSGKVLDITETFGPSTVFARVAKALACGYVVSTLVVGIIETEEIAFFWAYFTVISLVLATMYSIVSLFNSFFVPALPTGNTVQWRIKVTWTLFVLAVFGEALATIVFWFMVYEWGEPPTYLDIAMHGVVFVILLLEGFVVNRIPLRWMHLWMCWAYLVAFIIWSVIHGPIVLDIGNPNEEDNDPDTNDDAIYESLSWQDDDIWSSVILVAIIIFVGVPIIFGILRAMSAWKLEFIALVDRRRYIRTLSDLNDSRKEVDEPSVMDGDLYNDETEENKIPQEEYREYHVS